MIPPFGKYLVSQVGLKHTTGKLRIFTLHFMLASTK